MRRLLFITQTVDQDDPVLGFVTRWLKAFSEEFDVSVLCLKKGKHELKIPITSLGKELGGNRILYIMRFVRYIVQNRNSYDTVFVHMNPEYVIFGAPLWRFFGKKIVLWYNHTKGGFRLAFAMRFADIIFHTSPYSASAQSLKSKKMPAGIDTKLFTPNATIRSARTVLFLGRIAPIKGAHVLAESARSLFERSEDFRLIIVGDARPEDQDYYNDLKKALAPLIKVGKAEIHSGVSNTEAVRYFQSADIFVNLTPSGNYDKTVLEAGASGALPLVSSKAFADRFPIQCFFREDDASDLADKLKALFIMPRRDRDILSAEVRSYVVEKHDLDVLVKAIKEALS